MRSIIKKISIFITIWLLLFQWTCLTYAENALMISSKDNNAEGKISYVLNPGEKKIATFSVQNLSENENLVIKVYGVDGIQTKEGPWAFKTIDQSQTSIGAWLQFDQTGFTLPPQSNLNIPFSINITPGTAPGTYCGAIAIETIDTQNDKNQNAVKVTSRTVQTILISIPGEKKALYKVDDFSSQSNSQPNSLSSGSKIDFKLKIANPGNVLLVAGGNIEINDKFKPIASINLKENSILPGEKIENIYSWENTPLFGQFKAKLKLDFYEYNPVKDEKISIGNFQQGISLVIIPWFIIWALASLLLITLTIKLTLVIFKKLSLKNYIFYEVNSNDTITSISTKFNMSWKKLVSINKLKKPYNLKNGSRLLVKKNTVGLKVTPPSSTIKNKSNL